MGRIPKQATRWATYDPYSSSGLDSGQPCMSKREMGAVAPAWYHWATGRNRETGPCNLSCSSPHGREWREWPLGCESGLKTGSSLAPAHSTGWSRCTAQGGSLASTSAEPARGGSAQCLKIPPALVLHQQLLPYLPGLETCLKTSISQTPPRQDQSLLTLGSDTGKGVAGLGVLGWKGLSSSLEP